MAMAPWKSLAIGLLVAMPVGLPASRPAGAAAPPPPPPPPPDLPAARSVPSAGPEQHGNRLSIAGRPQRAAWLRQGEAGGPAARLWLPLEVLQGQLGVTTRSRADGGVDLEWFGRGQQVAAAELRTLGDEVAVDVAALLEASGVEAIARGDLLELRPPQAQLLQVRPSAAPPGLRRVVLDLSGPAAVRSGDRELEIGLRGDGGLTGRLAALGLRTVAGGTGLALVPAGGAPARVMTLGEPARVVIDLPAAPGDPTASASPPGRGGTDSGVSTPPAVDPRLQALLGEGLRWDRLVRSIGGRAVRINAVRLDPRSSPLELRPLSRGGGMEGLSSLSQLARRYDALVAINGGFFNRVRRLPLGALRDQGRWLSGPILNRGVVAWDPQSLPRFGRLQLEESLTDGSGRIWPVRFLNSGFVQRGLSRYTADWGPAYRAITGNETGLLLRDGVVTERFGGERLVRGVVLGPRDTLVVARSAPLPPWQAGERLTLSSRPSSDLGQATHVVGGGPLLLQDGRLVLNGAAEGFGSAFLVQGAPRTVIGSDGRTVWLVTLQGVNDEGPTLTETALLLQQAGLRDALNLDGGSSTGLVMGGNHTVKGRGVVSAVHNGLGLVPAAALPSSGARAGS